MTTKTLGPLAALIGAGLIVVSACGGDSKSSTTPAAKVTSAPTKAGSAPTSAAAAASPTTAAKPATDGKLPADACALLTTDEVHRLDATAGEGTKTTEQAAPGQAIVSCRWEWAEGITSLDVRVSTLPAGTTLDDWKSSLRASLNENGHEVSGVGDFAVLLSPIAADANVRALVNGLLLDIDLNGLGARAKQDQVIELAKAVAGRM